MTATHTTDRHFPQALRTPITGRTVLVLAAGSADVSAIVMQLAADDVEVFTAPSARAAAARLRGRPPTAVLVTAELERGTGYAALAQLRADETAPIEVPAIAFSAHAEPLDRLRALQRGCVDFLAAPIFYPELVARIQIAISRTRPPRTIFTVAGGLEVNQTAHTVRLHGQDIDLSRYEYELLTALAIDPERVWTKTELLAKVWGFQTATNSRTLDSHACRLRRKLRDCGGSYVHNVWGTGYRLLVTGPV